MIPLIICKLKKSHNGGGSQCKEYKHQILLLETATKTQRTTPGTFTWRCAANTKHHP